MTTAWQICTIAGSPNGMDTITTLIMEIQEVVIAVIQEGDPIMTRISRFSLT